MRPFVAAFQALLLLAVVDTASAQSQTLFTDDFEAGATGWTFANGANGQWHLAGSGSCTAVTNMLAYNKVPSCTYATGGFNSGDVITPSFVLGGQTPIRVGFQYIRFVDTVGETTCVRIREVGATDWVDVGCVTDNSGTLQSASFELPEELIGMNVEIGFRFAANALGNNRRGWLIDNVSVTNIGPPIAPVLASVSPDIAQNDGTGEFVITGTDFFGTSSVAFGSLEASFTIDSDTQITASLPASMLTGRKDVVLTSYAGASTLPASFSFYGAPVEIGEACDEFALTWAGVPIIGHNYTVRNPDLGLNNQILLVSWSNSPAASPYRWRLGTLLDTSPCGVHVDPTYVIRLGSSNVHTFVLPNDVGLVGTHLRTQALVRRTSGGPAVSTQTLDVLIVD